MKILQLRFKNLNSLHGEWFIDFSADEYVANGIFAITGPTGSGKSTILDAVCLALYGTTPRLDKITQSTNEVMSKKTGECFAEVVFSSQLGRFKCHWSQKRARGKAEGNLQAPKHEISDADTGKVIEAKRSEIIKIVEEKTGMDFVRFTRSILLAQGGFSAFLQATGNDRSAILEQITGTGIYSVISSRVFERQRHEKNILDKLLAESSGIMLLTREEEASLQKELAEFQSEFTTFSRKREEAAHAMQWLKSLDNLKAELDNIKQSGRLIAEQCEAFSKEKEKLHKAELAERLAGEFTALAITRQQQKEDNEILARLYQQQPAVKGSVEEHLARMRETEKQLEELKQFLSQQQPLFQRVRTLDSAMAEKLKLLTEAEKECENIQKQINENGQKTEKTEKSRQAAVVRHEKVIAYLSANSADERLISQFSAIESLFSALREIASEELRLQKDLEKQKLEIKNFEVLIKDCESEYRKCCEEHQSLTKEIAGQTEDLKAILQGRLLREYRQELGSLLKEAGYVKIIKSYEEHRARLEDGKPCPLCGSADHPFARGNVPELDENEKKTAEIEKIIDRAESVEARINDLGKSERELSARVIEAEKKLINARHVKETSEQSAKEKTADIGNLQQKNLNAREDILLRLREFGISQIADEKPESVLDSLKQKLEAWKLHQQQKTDIEAEITALSADLKGFEGIAATLAESLSNKQNAVAEIKSSFQGLEKERQDLFADRNPQKEESDLSERISVAEKTLNQQREEHEHKKVKLAELDSRISSLKDMVSKRSDEIATLTADFLQKLEKLGFADEPHFISMRLSHEERSALEQQARNLEKAQTENNARQLDLENRLKEEIEKNLTAAQVSEIENEISAYDEKIKALGERLGAVKQKLSDNSRAASLMSDKKALIEAQTRELRKWDNLNALIGSKEGTRFRNFAQGLTFGILVNHANQQLQKMTDRYLLTRDAEELLELRIIDQYQAGEIRSTKNLSGGESFIVSLALALGLAKMASRKVRVDSLFLDEGFGTLDDDALQTALDTLSALQQDDKLIGVISHVSALKQRISTQITVKKGPGGRSTLLGPGVERNS